MYLRGTVIGPRLGMFRVIALWWVVVYAKVTGPRLAILHNIGVMDAWGHRIQPTVVLQLCICECCCVPEQVVSQCWSLVSSLDAKKQKKIYRGTPQLKLFRFSSWMMLWFFVYRQANITYDFSVGVSCCRVVCLSKLAEMNQKVLGTAPGVSKSLGTPINL